MGLLLTLPLLLPLGSSLLLFATRHNRRASHFVAITSATVLLVLVSGLTLQVARDGLLVVAIGSWPPPYGIVLVADLLSVLMLLVCTLVAWATVLYSTAWIDPARERLGYYPLIFALLFGVNGTFLTGDIFNLYVWFEILLMSSFVLLVLGAERGQVEGGLKYVALNLLASAFS